MKTVIIGCVALCLLSFTGVGQNSRVSTKIKGQLPSSFYSEPQFKYDVASKRDIQNPQNKIVDNLDNPPGTLVLDGNADLKTTKELLEDPDKIVFTENHAEIVFQKHQTRYRIPVANVSRHHPLTDATVVSELKSFIANCTDKTGIVPALVNIKHNYTLEACEFLSFTSISDLYQTPYYQARLNHGCVHIKIYKKEFDLHYAYN